MAERKTKRTPEVEQLILEGLAAGTPLTVICRPDEMPSPRTVWDWEQADEEFAKSIAGARARGEEALLEQCLEIADEREGRAIMADGVEVAVVFDSTAIARNKLRVETRLKLLAKFNPKRWGDRQQIEHSGKVGLEALVAGQSSDDK